MANENKCLMGGNTVNLRDKLVQKGDCTDPLRLRNSKKLTKNIKEIRKNLFNET